MTSLLRGGFVSAGELRIRFTQIEPGLLRYPAIDAAQFKQKLEDFLAKAGSNETSGS